MATFSLPVSADNKFTSTSYINGGTPTNARITSVTDGESDLVFNVGDTVTVMWNRADGTAGTPYTAEYIGTVSVTVSGQTEPKDFMVLKWVRGTTTYYDVVGITNSDAPATIVVSGASANVSAETFTVCFFPGTLIATPNGERRVEDLAPGDPVMIGDAHAAPATWIGRISRMFLPRLGFERAATVKWLGRQTVSTLFGPAERLMPIRFAAGSLGGGGGGGKPLLPHSDLTVTADHAMLVDGVLCEAGALVNGTTITRVPLSEFGESYVVYHVETEAHEIIFANGAPSETFVDNVSRHAFDNHAEYEKLQSDEPEMKELPHPRASNARHLPSRIRHRLGIDIKRNSAA